MGQSRRRWTLAGVVLVALGLAFGAPAPVRAQSSGLLLGPRAHRPPLSPAHSPGQYRTLWIAPVVSKVQVAAEGPVLIVPRASGFWRVGVENRSGPCAPDEHAFAQPAHEPPPKGTRPPTTGELANCGPASDNERGDEVDILFVGPEHVATGGIGMGRRLSPFLSVERLGDGSPGKWLSVADVAGAPAQAAVDQLARKAVQELTLRVRVDDRRMYGDGKPMTDEERLEIWNEATVYGFQYWAIIREAGRWLVIGKVYPACDGCGSESAAFKAPVELPRDVVGHDRLTLDLPVIKKVVPTLQDAFVSPTGDLLVVLAADGLHAFRLVRGTIGERLLSVPNVGAQESVVMAQWATGPNVERWTRELRKILEP